MLLKMKMYNKCLNLLSVHLLLVSLITHHVVMLSATLTSDTEINIDDDLMHDEKKDIPYSAGLGYDSSYYDDEDKAVDLDIADHDWDVLIFTQQWPVTTCYHWREDDKTRPCHLPDQKEFWTIHGVWPTKLGQFGPSFCNKTAEFDLDKLERILKRMEMFWPDLEGKSDSQNFLWKHEWMKHGTCAALVEQLDNELKYFGQGLQWRDKFMISKMLDAADIHPDSNNTVIALNNALFNALGKTPSIHCLYDHKKDISLLAEIRICFNKTLDLIDCHGVKMGDAFSIKYPGGTVTTNCQIGKPVHYPSFIPQMQRKSEKSWKFPLVEVYKLLQFIMWFTL